MFCSLNPAHKSRNRVRTGVSSLVLALLLSLSAVPFNAQSFERELNNFGKSLLTIKNLNGRVSVNASDDEKMKVSFTATSAGAPVERTDVNASDGAISVRERRQPDRIDLVVHVPARAHVKVETETGMVDVIGNVEVA